MQYTGLSPLCFYLKQDNELAKIIEDHRKINRIFVLFLILRLKFLC